MDHIRLMSGLECIVVCEGVISDMTSPPGNLRTHYLQIKSGLMVIFFGGVKLGMTCAAHNGSFLCSNVVCLKLRGNVCNIRLEQKHAWYWSNVIYPMSV